MPNDDPQANQGTRGLEQASYRLKVGDWDSGAVAASATFQVKYSGTFESSAPTSFPRGHCWNRPRANNSEQLIAKPASSTVILTSPSRVFGLACAFFLDANRDSKVRHSCLALSTAGQ